LIDRIRVLEFPQILFLPKFPGVFDGDGLLRLDHLQSVFLPHLEPTQFGLAEDVQKLVKDQLACVLTCRLSPRPFARLLRFSFAALRTSFS
jgi:hypothetical protein